MSGTAIAGAVAAKRAIERVVDELYDSVHANVRRRIAGWRTDRKIADLYRKIRHVRLVKTIWQPEKEIDLATFYYPSKILIEGKAHTVHSLGDIPYSGSVVIKGTVGQGKSMFLRYLTSVEVAKGSAIPLFAELRRIGEEEPLVDHLLKELVALGLLVDRELFTVLAQHGKLLLFLDAFDEVKEENRDRVLGELEVLLRCHDQLRAVVTTRPIGVVENSPLLRVFELAPLAEGEYKEVVGRFANDKKVANEICAAVKKNPWVCHLLTTPLMVALLMVRFKIDQSVPDNVIAFYDQLFMMLLQRHDKLKAGYTRPRKSKVSDLVLQDVFNAICFLTRRDRSGALTTGKLYEIAKEGIRIRGQECDPVKVVEDIRDITCLILEEGDEIRFIHRSVQEYHAACFVRQQPDSAAAEFYAAMHERWQRWRGELDFLALIDRYRYAKWFAVGEYLQFLGIADENALPLWKPSSDQIAELGMRMRFDLTEQEQGGYYCSGFSTPWSIAARESFYRDFARALFTKGLSVSSQEALDRGMMVDGAEDGKRHILNVPAKALLRDPSAGPLLCKYVEQAQENVFGELKELISYVKHVEQNRVVFSFA